MSLSKSGLSYLISFSFLKKEKIPVLGIGSDNPLFTAIVKTGYVNRNHIHPHPSEELSATTHDPPQPPS
jgi:hypothetical protein